MAFGLKAFKRVKDNAVGEQNKRRHFNQVILGADLASVLKLCELKNEFGPEALRLISHRPLNRQMLLETYQYSVSTLRDQETILQILKKFPHASAPKVNLESLFYKDGKWHEFNGRAKPMELLKGEQDFQATRFDLNIEKLFTESDWANLDEILRTYQEVRMLEYWEKTTPAELVEQAEWLLGFGDESEVTCTHLSTSAPAHKLMKFSSQGQSIPAAVSDWLAGVEKQGAISLWWELKKELLPEVRTLFIPQSMTHEWGHFILDIHPYDEAKKCYPVGLLFLLHDEEPLPEDMAQKIKLAKRVIERVFPDFEKNIQREYIHAADDFFERVGDSASLDNLLVEVPTLSLIGQIGAYSGNTQHLGRSLLSI